MARCPDADTLGSLVAGTLPVADRADIATHAASCSHCHALLAGLVDAPTLDASEAGGDVGAILPGTLVGRYRVDGGLGAGGMGIVYAATDADLERRVALKLLRSESHAGAPLRERLLREARTLARLSHPNVVTVFDVGEHAGQLFVAMELVDGGTLGAWLARAPRTLDDIVARMIEAGRGVAAAHAAGVVHRDIKPDNILVGQDGRARVTDFGLARLDELTEDAPLPAAPLETLTRTGTLMGTPLYMAPEQLLRRTATPETDQWSFAATLYEAVAGVRPFAGDEPARTAAITRGELSLPAAGRRVPTWLRAIVTRALRADPDQRWPSVAALVEALTRRDRRRRSIVIASAVAVLGGATVAVAAHRAPPAAAAHTAGLVDQRPGCSCPYSACTGQCVSVCSAARFRLGARVPGVSVPGRQEALLGASSDGATLLYLAGERCGLDHLFLARRRGDTFESIDLTAQLDARVAVFEGCCTLSRDSQRVLLTNATRTGFVAGTITGDRITLGGEVGALAPSPRGTVRFPVLSDDDRTLYYRFNEPSLEPDDTGPLDGTYSAHRATTDAAFGEPRRLGGRARHYEYPSGVSSDGLSLFFSSDFETHVMVRETTAEPFGDPAWTVPPARIQGWRSIPLAGCRQLVTTSTPGGCESEDIAYLDAIDE